MVETQPRQTRRVLQGVVTSSQMAKTITVRVERAFRHPKYGKIVRQHKKYHAHDEQELARVGDQVEIASTRPISKIKRWRLARIVVSAASIDVETDATNPETLNRAALAQDESA